MKPVDTFLAIMAIGGWSMCIFVAVALSRSARATIGALEAENGQLRRALRMELSRCDALRSQLDRLQVMVSSQHRPLPIATEAGRAAFASRAKKHLAGKPGVDMTGAASNDQSGE